ncbi:sporulation protein YtxC [Peribacillus sp. FSL H8-0477]|uniref:sporulation protein YtxC n=1 Tax=Peribacillus sp. FSL H8-0477 TaxID=2921388 RepID=UPI0030F8DF17
MHIYFQGNGEAEKLNTIISDHPLWTELHTFFQWLPKNELIVDLDSEYMEKMHMLLSDAFYTFFLTEKIWEWLEQIITLRFYFRERDEIDAILDISAAIIEGERLTGENQPLRKIREMISEGLTAVIFADGQSFSFDSFAMFRLRAIYDILGTYVEHAIDEYKLEQDYQSFLASLRDCLKRQEPKMKVLHLLHQNDFSFYTADFRKVDKKELQMMINRRLFAGNLIYVDSTTLAPLISIAPERVYLYSDHAEDGHVRAIVRLFEERSIIRPITTFFDLQKKAIQPWDDEAIPGL